MTTTTRVFIAHASLPDDFLPLTYTAHSHSYASAAESELYFHPWAKPDDIWMAAQIEIEPTHGRDSFTVWGKQVSRRGGVTSAVAAESEADGTWWQSPELYSFGDAEAFTQFAWARWRATGRFSAAGMAWRSDLDLNRNPYPAA